MEPISSLIIAGAIGGGAGKFAEKAWDSGEKWIKSYFKDHKEIALQKGIANSLEFLTELASRVKQLEESNKVSKEVIEAAQDHPDFSVFLQKAILTSAQTDDKEKHSVLASLVSQRLVSSPESLLSLASKMACDSIAFMTNTQMRFLALMVNLHDMQPSEESVIGDDKLTKIEKVHTWLNSILLPYIDLQLGNYDIKHLVSLSCLTIEPNPAGRSMKPVLMINAVAIDFSKLQNYDLIKPIERIWIDTRIDGINTTTTGAVIGVMVSDLISGATTDLTRLG